MIEDNKISVNDLSSPLQPFGWANYIVFILMLIICGVIGIYFGVSERAKRMRTRSTEGRGGNTEAVNYLVGDRKMQVLPVSLSLIATIVSGISLLGTPTEVYVYGTQYAFILIGITLSGITAWYAFLPVLHGLQLTSIYEYLELRFDKRIRLFGAVLSSIAMILWLPVVIYVPALALNQVTGINIHVITPVVSIVCIFYTCVGGIKAVIWTDVIQTLIMIGSLFVVMIKGTRDIGGLGVVWNRNLENGRLEIPELTIDPTVRNSVLSVVFGGSFLYLQMICHQVMMQRFLSLPTLRTARRTLVVFIVGLIITLGCCIYNGLLAYATYYNCDPLTTKLVKAKDQLVPLLVMDVLGVYPGIPGLFVAGVFSAAMSSLSSGLNCVAAIALEDFCKRHIKKPLTEKQIAILMRSIVVLCGMICVGLVYLMENMGTVLQLSLSVEAVIVCPVFGFFIIGVFIPWINGNSAFVGGVVSLVIMIWISLKTRIDVTLGKTNTKEKPVSIDGCTYKFLERDTIWNSTTTDIPELHEEQFYHISYLLYSILGILITIVIAGITSLICGKQRLSDVDPVLVAPILRKFTKPREYVQCATR